MDKSTYDAPKLLCCRACLATDSKLLNIHEYHLADVFSCVSGTPVFSDRLPQHLCIYCSALLTKCKSFRAMCVWTQQRLMTELLKEGVTLTTDFIRTIDKPSQQPLRLSFTRLETIDCIETLPQYDIKEEPNIDIVDIDSIINPVVLKTEPNNKKDEVKLNDGNTEGVFVVNNVKGKERKRKSETKVKKIMKIEIDTEDNETCDYEEDIAISQLKRIDVKDKKRKTGRRVNKIAREETRDEYKDGDIDDEANVKDVDEHIDVQPVKVKRKRKKKEEVTRKFRKPENGFMPVFDFGKFESTYGVRVVTLTKEEQLAEIEARKLSANYLSCPFRCEDCGKGFLAEGPYANHRKRHSPSMGPHACEICSVRFRMQCRRQEHQDLHRLKILCLECDFVSRNRHQARRHRDVHAGKTFECQHCGKSFMKCSTHLSHVRLAHPAMNVACDVCGETFVGRVGLRQHKSKMHSEDTKPQQYKCPACAAPFVSLDALNRHTDAADHGQSPCAQCGESCADAASLSAHVRERHTAEEHRCEECSLTFVSAASFCLHAARKHRDQRASRAGQRRPVRERPRIGRFICELCGQTVCTATLLRYHQRIHQAVKPFACSRCPKTFAAKHARDWHERTHTGERPFQCPLCPLAFSLKGNLKRHHKAVHLGLRKSIPCSICRRVFSSGSGLRIHINTTHKGMPWPKRTRRKKDKRDNGESDVQ